MSAAWDSTKNKKVREIIAHLGVSVMTPTMLAKELDVHEVAISRYLKILKDDGLVKVKRKQNQLFYSLDRKQWKKHVDATINLAGKSFSEQFDRDLKKHLLQNLSGNKDHDA